MTALAASPSPTACDGDDARWAAVRARDPSSDGAFVYSVETTGVYCRPSCPSRAARREHVRFHADVVSARRAGFRPCLRCRPDEPSAAERRAALVAAARQAIEAAEGAPPSLADLARAAGLSPHHFHRLFRAEAGVTPGAYARQVRAERLRAALPSAPSVTAAGYDAGYSSSGRLYADAPGALGMTPGAWRAGGAGEVIRFAAAPCSLGRVLAARTERGVCAVLLGDDDDALRADLAARFPRARLEPGGAGSDEALAWAVALVDAPARDRASPALDLHGTAFQQRVWRALQETRAGETVSYAELAERAGAPGAVRAVAGACAANPVAVAVPCHRAVRKDGALAGYRWGLERKRELLAREAAAVSPPGPARV